MVSIQTITFNYAKMDQNYVIAIVYSLFGVCVWGVVGLKLNFDFSYFYPSDSAQYVYYNVEENYYPNNGLPIGIYTETIDYSNAQTQQNLYKLCNPSTGTVATEKQYIQQGIYIYIYSTVKRFHFFHFFIFFILL